MKGECKHIWKGDACILPSGLETVPVHGDLVVGVAYVRIVNLTFHIVLEPTGVYGFAGALTAW